MGEQLVETDDLSKTYGAVTAVDRVSLTVWRGEVYGFLGPNGAGKTTTLRMLAGLVRPTAGSASVHGDRPGSPRALARTGVLIEAPRFYPYLSGRDNLRVVARYAGVPDPRVEAVLETVDLAGRGGDGYAGYSLGMKQRLGVAAALLKDPELLILDEPTNGLDPAGMRDMRALLRDLGERGHTVLLSSHLLGEVQQLCDRVGVISGGRLLAESTVDDLLGQAGLLVRAEPLDAGPRVPRAAGRRRQRRRGRRRLPAADRAGAGGEGQPRPGRRRGGPDRAAPAGAHARRGVPGDDRDREDGTMTGSFAAEILKLRKRPATWILLGVALALNQLFGYLLPYSSWVTGGQNEQTQGLDPQAVLAGTLPGELVPTSLGGFPVFAGALALILGALAAGSEYGWGTMQTALTQRPTRLAVYGGKLAALAASTLAIVLATFALNATTAAIIATLESRPLDYPSVADPGRGHRVGLADHGHVVRPRGPARVRLPRGRPAHRPWRGLGPRGREPGLGGGRQPADLPPAPARPAPRGERRLPGLVPRPRRRVQRLGPAGRGRRRRRRPGHPLPGASTWPPSRCSAPCWSAAAT